MKFGIIGTGNMGGLLIDVLIERNIVSPEKVYIHNRTIEKAEKYLLHYPDIHVKHSAPEVIENTDIIFICVKPKEYYPLITENRSLFKQDKCLVTITSPISVHQVEKVVACSCARVIPSITNRAFSGVSLLTFAEQCSEYWKEMIHRIFSNVSVPYEIKEDVTRVTSDIVSCGPAFFTYMTRRFIKAAEKETTIDEETATVLASHMLIGLGDLLKKGHYTLPTLQQKVCVQGGVTGVGINVLEEGLEDIFEKLFQATHKKFADDKELVGKQFGEL